MWIRVGSANDSLSCQDTTRTGHEDAELSTEEREPQILHIAYVVNLDLRGEPSHFRGNLTMERVGPDLLICEGR